MEDDVSKDMSLRFSKEGDKFLALDSDAKIDIPPGEALYATGNTVITRHINWKQSKEGLIKDTTTSACYMAEVLNGYPPTQLDDMQDEFKKKVVELLHVEPEVHIVDERKPTLLY